jgi:hypothetical protein
MCHKTVFPVTEKCIPLIFVANDASSLSHCIIKPYNEIRRRRRD